MVLNECGEVELKCLCCKFHAQVSDTTPPLSWRQSSMARGPQNGDETRQDKTRYDKTEHDKTRQDHYAQGPKNATKNKATNQEKENRQDITKEDFLNMETALSSMS